MRLGIGVDRLVGEGARVAAVHLADGTELPAQMVVVGIGIVPAVQPLLAAGAAGGNGVEIDALCRTSLPDVFAIGDCAAVDARCVDPFAPDQAIGATGPA